MLLTQPLAVMSVDDDHILIDDDRRVASVFQQPCFRLSSFTFAIRSAAPEQSLMEACVFAPRSWAAIQYKKLTAEYLALTDSGKGKEG